MLIAFIHDDKSFLPEMAAYQRFFKPYDVTCELVKRGERRKSNRQVDWFFMGSDLTPREPGVYKIHEYLSASFPPARRWKNFIKSHINKRPDFRLFLSPYVKDSFYFTDNVPFGLRDMGIWPDSLQPPAKTIDKIYDFIYCGSVKPDIGIEKVLDCFMPGGSMEHRSILVLSRYFEPVEQRYAGTNNIHFKGPVAHDEVPAFIHQARFAISYKPDTIPHRFQTVTKLIEYAGCHVPVITSAIPWVRSFQEQYGGNFFYLEPDLSNFTWERVNAFAYAYPDLTEWTWERQIGQSGIVEFLRSKFPEAFS